MNSRGESWLALLFEESAIWLLVKSSTKNKTRYLPSAYLYSCSRLLACVSSSHSFVGQSLMLTQRCNCSLFRFLRGYPSEPY